MATKKIVEESRDRNCESCNKHKYSHGSGSNGSAVYAIGICGAAYYFFSQAVGIQGFFIAILKTLGWPAILVYNALTLLKL